ncbi:hypothetical protein DMUE_0063 [Dictyocoela muelleri]|nr:hypothetical protein DMUE_0063 [Dictyocoela muelleri]
MFSKNNQKRESKHYNMNDKLSVLDYKGENPFINQKELQNIFKMSAGIIDLIQKNEAMTRNQSKIKEGNKNIVFMPKINKTIYPILYEMFNIKRNKNHVITNDILSEKALIIDKSFDFHDFKASSKWGWNFKKYYNIKYRQISVEEGLVNLDELAVTWPNFKGTLGIFFIINLYF